MQATENVRELSGDQVWRERSFSEKWLRIGELNQMLRSCFRASFRLRFPGFTERQIHRELLFQVAGESKFNEMIAAGRMMGRHLPSVAEYDEDQLDEPFLLTFAE